MFDKDTHHRVSSSDPDTTVTYIVIFQDYNTENKTIVEMLWSGTVFLSRCCERIIELVNYCQSCNAVIRVLRPVIIASIKPPICQRVGFCCLYFGYSQI